MSRASTPSVGRGAYRGASAADVDPGANPDAVRQYAAPVLTPLGILHDATMGSSSGTGESGGSDQYNVFS